MQALPLYKTKLTNIYKTGSSIMYTLDLQEHSHDVSVSVALILMTNDLQTLNLSQNVYPSQKGRNYTKEHQCSLTSTWTSNSQ